MKEEFQKIAQMLESREKEMHNLGLVLAVASFDSFGDYRRFEHVYINGNCKIQKGNKRRIKQIITSKLKKKYNGN